MSKGSKRRPGKPGAFERGYEAIDWTKGRPKAARVPVEWVIPPLSEILGGSYGMPDPDVVQAVCGGRGGCTNPPAAPHPCPFASEINGSEVPCTCCADCAHGCAMDI